jgi:hypothetical protein
MAAANHLLLTKSLVNSTNRKSPGFTSDRKAVRKDTILSLKARIDPQRTSNRKGPTSVGPNRAAAKRLTALPEA